MKSRLIFLGLCIVAALVASGIMISSAQGPVGTAFTYQGQLKNAGALVGVRYSFVVRTGRQLKV